MYKVKILSKKNLDGWWDRHEIGMIVDLGDLGFNHWIKKAPDSLQLIEHYRMATKSSKICPCCNKRVVKREKIVLDR